VSVVARGLSHVYGDLRSLDSIELEARPGEVVALVGPSGCGKSTLLEIAAGLREPSAGTIAVEGSSDAAGRLTHCAYMPQRDLLLPWFSALDNAALALRNRGVGKAEARSQAGELFERFGLAGFEKARPQELSGGMRQRVAFLRTLVAGKPVLLLDEPFGALDAKVRRELRRWLRDIHDRTGHTTVFVTHDQDEALEVADRVVVMNTGRIEQVGGPDEIYDAPATPFVFDFIGESSRFEVEVFSGKPYFDERPVGLPFNDLPEGRSTVYFRPHDVSIGLPGPGLISGTITSLRRAGATRRLEIAIGPGQRTVEADAAENHSFRVGQRAGLNVKRARAFPARAAPRNVPSYAG